MAYTTASIAVLVAAAHAQAGSILSSLTIPDVKETTKRPITVDDVVALRHIDTVSIAPDGLHLALFIRQADAVANEYRTGWFIGGARGGVLTAVGDGGQVRPSVDPAGGVVGDIEGRESRWSPDGQWIAYLLESDDKTQLWRSRVDGKLQEQLTHNAADVREFVWSEDGQALYFRVGTPRIEQRGREEMRDRSGYRYDQDLWSFVDFMRAQMPRAPETDPAIWVIALGDRTERRGGDAEGKAFEAAQRRLAGGIESAAGFAYDAAVSPVRRPDGALVWLARTAPTSKFLRVTMSRSPGSQGVSCTAEECTGVIVRVWWSADGARVFFWRKEGINETAQGIYAWSPERAAVSPILRAADDVFQHCSPAAADRLICVRETKTRPDHLVAIDLRAGAMEVLADVNPEFRNIEFGRVERFEWDTPTFAWNEPGGKLAGLYPKRAYGYILYPPHFDPARKYPVFIEPYVAGGFASTYASEHAMHVYAATGFVVLDMAFPVDTDVVARLGAGFMAQTYSPELNFPHLTMLMESTVRGLDVAAARGFIDATRVGIGGVSHGTFIPLYMMQKHDRIAAISISGGGFGPEEYYWPTRKGREALGETMGKIGFEDWRVNPRGEGRKFWDQIDIAEHIDTIEAPILMHLAAHEAYPVVRFIRHLSDEGKPYDAYIFPNETHFKWQPAHLKAIYDRNLDWFRFWLQDYEDSVPAKSEQYARWTKLREQQCLNLRALRKDHC